MSSKFDEHFGYIQHAVTELTNNYPFPNIVYKRFFIGNKENVENTIKAMVNHWRWRLVNNADNISSSDCSTILRKNIAVIQGRDRENRPIVNVMVSNHDKNDRDIKEFKNFIIYTLEKLLQAADPEKQRVTMVFDLYNAGFPQLDFEILKMLIDIVQVNYPEVLEVVLVVNAPYIVIACWSIIKPWLDPGKHSYSNHNFLLFHIFVFLCFIFDYSDFKESSIYKSPRHIELYKCK